FHIWRQRALGGSEPEQLTFGVDQEEGVEPEHGGRSFLTAIGRLTSTVWVHDARGDRQITTEGFGMSPSLTRDGRRLFYLVRAGRTPPRRLLRDEGLEALFGAGDDVLYSTREGNENVIYQVSADGGGRRAVVRASNLFGVSPDGRWIATWQAALPDGLTNVVMVYPVAGGAPRMICAQCGPPPAFERGR